MAPARALAEVVLFCDGAEVASWPLLCAHRLDLTFVDEVARLQLEARRRGCSIRLRQACPSLIELLELVGLSEMIRAPDHLAGA